MKRLSLAFNILFVIVIIVLVSILIRKNNIINEEKNKYLELEEEKNLNLICREK